MLTQTVLWMDKAAKYSTRNIENKGWDKRRAKRGEELDRPLCAACRMRQGTGIRL